jgi:hypothetical protein
MGVDLGPPSYAEVSLRCPSLHTYSHTPQFPSTICVIPASTHSESDGGDWTRSSPASQQRLLSGIRIASPRTDCKTAAITSRIRSRPFSIGLTHIHKIIRLSSRDDITRRLRVRAYNTRRELRIFDIPNKN